MCTLCREKLLDSLLPKISKETDPLRLTIQFVDDEGDAVLITNDENLMEATDLALKTGNQIVKLTVSLTNDANPLSNPVVLGGIAVGVVAILALGMMMFSKPRR